MRRTLPIVVAVLAATAATAQPTIYVSPDVAVEPDGPDAFLPWQIVEHVSGGPSFYALLLQVPGTAAIDGIHKMDRANNWLFSVEAPSDLGGTLEVQPSDVVRSDGGSLSLFFDAGCVSPPVPDGSNVDALFLSPDDNGELFVSFDVPTESGGTLFLPSAVVRYDPVGAGPCDWTLAGLELDLAAVSSTYFPASTNVTGLDLAGDDLIVSFDIPVDLAPTSGPSTWLTGQIAVFDLALGNWDLFEDLLTQGTPGWPVAGQVDALSCQANPGKIEPSIAQILLDKALPDIVINCPASCSSGGEVYGVYEGTLASLSTGTYDHAQISCTAPCPGSGTFSPGAGDRYYLVVPHNFKEEGSYGVDSGSGERPQPTAVADRCVEIQTLTACP